MSATSDSSSLAGTTVAVVGLGVLGGSLVRALTRLPDAPRVLGASPDALDRKGAEREGAALVAADAADVVGQADLVVYATHLSIILEMMEKHAGLLRAEALATDVAGLKVPVLDAAARAGLGSRFVGAHPMAGSEGSGFAGGRADLFQGARVFLSAHRSATAAARQRAEALWRALDTRPIWIPAEDHDRLMVKVSQLPQLVSNALASVLAQERISAADLGPGGRDMTRLAQSPPAMWGDILAHTGVDAGAMLRTVARRLEEIADRLEADDVAAVSDLMTRTQAWRTEAQDAARRQRNER